jgi:hypothetical protein
MDAWMVFKINNWTSIECKYTIVVVKHQLAAEKLKLFGFLLCMLIRNIYEVVAYWWW